MYTVNGKEYSETSATNQMIIKAFMRSEAFACVTDLMDELLSTSSSFELEDFYNISYDGCPSCSGTEWHEPETPEERQDFAEILGVDVDEFDELEAAQYRVCDSCGYIYSEDETETVYAEPSEYWIVSDWLGEQLRRRGEMVLERSLGWIWGRQMTGQEIILDDVIQRIVFDLGILDGQRHQWNVGRR